MSKYNNKDFINALTKKMNDHKIRRCPYCGNEKFSSPEQFATILINDDLLALNLGPSIPAGILVCENCGHIDFFALGALGLLNKKEESMDGK